MMLADVLYALDNLGNNYSLGNVIDGAWLLSYGLFGAALLHPSMRDLQAMPAARPLAAPALVDADSLARAAVLDLVRVVEPPGHALRLGLIAIWTGRSLLGLGVLALILSATWLSPDIILVSGAYAVTGVAMLIAGSFRTSFR